MPLSTGARLGPYEILALIGAGGMGEVWKARDTRLDRVVAIKVSKEKFSERFEREARAVAALNHLNICTLYDVGPNYLVMEYVEGQPIQGPLAVEKAVAYARQVLDALDTAHRQGIVHRDLKPANILLTKNGVKLLDFGLAKTERAKVTSAGDETVTKAITQEGAILGTLQYMSPEQLQCKVTDARSDLFSFGCVLYEMLTGKRAFEGATAPSVIAAILEREPAPPEVSPPLERVVRSCVAKDPDERIQTARDVKKALEWAVEPQSATGTAKPSRQWQWIAAAALVLGVLAGGWAVSHFRQPADDHVLQLDITAPEGGQFVFTGNATGGTALSPDGKVAACIAIANGKSGLWVRSLDSATARFLPGTEGASDPFWSPDSKSIGFWQSGRIMRTELAGGMPVTIGESSGNRGGAWSPDGRIVLGVVATGLFQVRATGGKPSPLTLLDASRGETAHYWPQMLPGRRFLFWVRSNKPEETGIYGASLDKPSERVRLLVSDTSGIYATARRRNRLSALHGKVRLINGLGGFFCSGAPNLLYAAHSWHQEPTAPTSLTNWYDVVWNSSREEEPYEKQMAGCQPSLYCFPAERGAAQRPSLVCRRIRHQQTHQVYR